MLRSNSLLVLVLVVCILATSSYFMNPSKTSMSEKKNIKAEMNVSGNPVSAVNVYKNRRSKLMDKIKDGIFILSSAKPTEENFYYLTGLEEDNSICVLLPNSSKPFHMFVLPDEPSARLWTGKRSGIKGAVEDFGADYAYVIDNAAKILNEMLPANTVIYSDPADYKVRDLIGELGKKNIKYENPRPLVDELRVFKDEYEIEQLRKACNISCEAYIRAVKKTQPGLVEHEIQAEIEYVFTKNGLQTGYPSIVGSGPNAAILHYEKNNRIMQTGELLLMDVGAACNHYSADLTRTIPVNGKFLKEQKELYELILKAQTEGIKEMLPGKNMLDCHHKATKIIIDGLVKMGLITDSSKYWQKRFYIQYRNDHYIGLNVHDAGSYGEFNAAARDEYILDPKVSGRKLEAGMVLTMEPGLYFASDRIDQIKEIFPNIDKKEIDEFVSRVKPVYLKYSGIGIRIEDDILITPGGNDVLTSRAPKSIEDIEKLMKSSN